MTIREANLDKATRRCLKCGKLMRTDRCHRLCVPCSQSNEAFVEGRGTVGHELRPWVRTLVWGEAEPGGAAVALAALEA